MTDEELNKLADALAKRMEPLVKEELERMFTNYMSTRTLLEPELVKKLFDAMGKDLNRFIDETLQRHGVPGMLAQLKKYYEDALQRRTKEGPWVKSAWKGPYEL
jgi:hypothetical protein